MNIGDVSRLSGLPPKTIRYYEDIELITPLRSPNGYRTFRERDLHELGFLGRARSLGFSIEDCRSLLELYRDKGRDSADVKQLAQKHLEHIDTKIRDLSHMRATLSHLIETCNGDQRPACPILADLATVQTDPSTS